MKNYPNGIENWIETHHDICFEIAIQDNQKDEYMISPVILKIRETTGTGGMYELTKDLTDKFEAKYDLKGQDEDYYDLLEAFLSEELNG